MQRPRIALQGLPALKGTADDGGIVLDDLAGDDRLTRRSCTGAGRNSVPVWPRDFDAAMIGAGVRKAVLSAAGNRRVVAHIAGVVILVQGRGNTRAPLGPCAQIARSRCRAGAGIDQTAPVGSCARIRAAGLVLAGTDRLASGDMPPYAGGCGHQDRQRTRRTSPSGALGASERAGPGYVGSWNVSGGGGGRMLARSGRGAG